MRPKRPLSPKHFANFAISVLILCAALWFILVLGTRPASAHPHDELIAWQNAWVGEVMAEGGLTPEMVEAWVHMREAHGCDWPRANCVFVQPQARSVTPPSDQTHSYDVEQWRPLVESYFQPADVPWAMRVMACESRGDPYAKNPRSTASGLFQMVRYWWSGASAYPAFDPFNPEANIRAAAWLFYEEGASQWVCR
jgi:hypothetical protein